METNCWNTILFPEIDREMVILKLGVESSSSSSRKLIKRGDPFEIKTFAGNSYERFKRSIRNLLLLIRPSCDYHLGEESFHIVRINDNPALITLPNEEHRIKLFVVMIKQNLS